MKADTVKILEELDITSKLDMFEFRKLKEHIEKLEKQLFDAKWMEEMATTHGEFWHDKLTEENKELKRLAKIGKAVESATKEYGRVSTEYFVYPDGEKELTISYYEGPELTQIGLMEWYRNETRT